MAKDKTPKADKGEEENKARAFYREGNEHYEKGEFDEAIGCYTKAIGEDPFYDKAFYNRGLAFACKEEYDKAISDIKRVIELKPDFAEAYHVLGLAHEYKNELQEAIDAYTKALKLNPDFRDAQNRLELVMSKKDRAERAPAGASPMKASGGETQIEEGKIKEVVFLEKPKMTFKDVAGMERMKETIFKFIVWPFKDPKLAEKYGMKAGGGVLLYGPPGCGKTFIAKATAGECSANFINARISDIVDMYAGNTEKNLHKIFVSARQAAPSIVFFDEVEALGGKREGEQQQHMRMAVNQMLSEMDGIESTNDNVLIMAATNMPWDVDPALRRSGRFGNVIYVPPPDFKSRIAIFKLECRNRPIGRIAWNRIALATWGYSSADLKQVVKEAAMIPWEQEFKTGKGRELRTGDFIRVIRARKSTLPPWYQLTEKEIVGKKETSYVDGKPHITEKPGKIGPEEQETYRDLIKEIKNGNKFYWKYIRMAVKYFALYVPIPF
jgi:SpoVK/Ycf46/Vps4 family AAA+-type ATPase